MCYAEGVPIHATAPPSQTMLRPIAAPDPPSPALGRIELGLILLATLLGTFLRLNGVGQVAVSHFDEGVYASNIWFGPATHFAYPARHLYAPPLLPGLIELSFTLFGPGDWQALLPGLISGCLLVPLVWWVGREWVGPTAGLFAGFLAALNGPHIEFSRSALTDPLLCLFLTAAVYLSWRAIRHGGAFPLLAAAALSALAWWTKYNGWLPLAIVGSAVPPWLWFRRQPLSVGRLRPGVSRGTGQNSADCDDSINQAESAIPAGCAPSASPADVESSAQTLHPAGQTLAVEQPESIPERGVSRETPGSPPVPRPVSRETPQLAPIGGAVSRETALRGKVSPGVPRETPTIDRRPVGGGVSRETAESPSATRVVGRLVLIFALAAAAWAPCLWSLQSLGGYEAVAQNHRRYVLGVNQAPETASRQFAALRMLEEGTSRGSLIVAFAVIMLSGWLTGRAMDRVKSMTLGVASLCAIVTGSVPITGLLGVSGVALLAFRTRRSEGRCLASWLIAAWLIGLSLAIPCYAPYPRLTLPWLVVTWFAAAAWVEEQSHSGSPRRGLRRFLPSAVPLILITGSTLVSQRSSFPPKPSRPDQTKQTGMRTAARRIATAIRRELEIDDRASLDQVVIYLYGEPALFFQLRLAGVTCHPVQDLGFATTRGAVLAPTFVIVGERSLRDPQFAQQRRAANRLVTIEEMTVKLPRLVWLDEPWGPATETDAAPGEYRFEILRVGDSH